MPRTILAAAATAVRYTAAVVTLRARLLPALLALLILAPAPSRAARPLDTEDTGTVDPGRAELELSADHARFSDEHLWLAKAVLSAGVVRGLEARVETGVLLRDGPDQPFVAGASDTLLGFKYRVLDESASAPALLGGLTLRLPTGDGARGLGVDGVDVGALVAASKTLGGLALTANAGYTFVTSERDLDFWTFALSAEYRVHQAWALVAETVAFVPRDAAALVILRAGTVWTVSPRLKLDGAVGVGLTPPSPDATFTLGLSFVLF